MSFNIYVSGNPNRFTHEMNGLFDDDVFQAASIISAMRSSGPSLGGMAQAGANYIVPSTGGGVRQAYRLMARMVFLRQLGTSLALLAARPGSRNGWIGVSASNTSTWPDSFGSARYNFSPRVNPGLEFTERIIPALEAAEMNNFGVLREFGIVFSLFNSHIGRNSGTIMLNIQLSK